VLPASAKNRVLGYGAAQVIARAEAVSR
jgi:hypothetical protein